MPRGLCRLVAVIEADDESFACHCVLYLSINETAAALREGSTVRFRRLVISIESRVKRELAHGSILKHVVVIAYQTCQLLVVHVNT